MVVDIFEKNSKLNIENKLRLSISTLGGFLKFKQI